MTILRNILLIGLVASCFLGNAGAAEWQSNYGTHSGLSDKDDDNELFSLGFDFTFYGEVYDEIYGTTNGGLFFEDVEDYEIGTEVEGSYGPVIAAFLADLYPEGGGDIYTNILGDAGDQRFVMTWLDVIDYEEEFVNTFQAILYQNGDIRLNYLDLKGSGDGGGEDVIGLSQGDDEHFNYFIAENGSEDRIEPTGKSLLYTWNPASSNYNVVFEELTNPSTSVPEPSTLAIFAFGILGLASRRFIINLY